VCQTQGRGRLRDDGKSVAAFSKRIERLQGPRRRPTRVSMSLQGFVDGNEACHVHITTVSSTVQLSQKSYHLTGVDLVGSGSIHFHSRTRQLLAILGKVDHGSVYVHSILYIDLPRLHMM